MKTINSLILGTTAGLLAMSGAHAADLPVKAKAVEYVRICSLYGAGFFYIPGTDTCIKLGGYLKIETDFNASSSYNAPAWAGNSGQANRLRLLYNSRAREDFNIDTRTATEYGVLRTYWDMTANWGDGVDTIAGGTFQSFLMFIQFAGFTFGKAISQYQAPWSAYPAGNLTSALLGTENTSTGVNQLAYTAQFGNGVSGSLSLEDQSAYNNAQVFNALSGGTAATWFAGTGPTASGLGGNTTPDIVGQLRVDQAWGLFQLSAVAHDIHASYYNPALVTSGHPNDAWGGGVQAALSIKNIPTGPGDTINMSAGYTLGASRYIFGGTSPNALSMYGGSSLGYASVGFAANTDGIYGTGGQIEKTEVFGVNAGYVHNWDAYWVTGVYGAITWERYNANAKALYCAGMGLAVPGQGVTYGCNPDFNIAQVGIQTSWTPVKKLTFGAEVLFTALNQGNSGVTGAAVAPIAPQPTAVYQFKNQKTITVGVVATRVW